MKGLLCVPEMAVAVMRDVAPKTVTRRVIVPQPNADGICTDSEPMEYGYAWRGSCGNIWRCDYKVGEVRCLLTTWAVSKEYDHLKPTALNVHAFMKRSSIWHAGMGERPEWCGKSRPGRFLPNSLRPLMPDIEIISVRAERVQDITPADCRAEGMPAANNDIGVRYGFGQLWNSINEKRGYGWAKNPWVWRIEFKRISP
jgi:hypothetical protein